jgi:putative colanic acid biosynthesis acetyltransferase WcaF
MNTSTRLDLFANPEYKPGTPFQRVTWYIVNALLFNTWIPFSSFKIALLRLWGAKIGSGVVIKPKVNIKHPWLLEIGDHSWIGEGVWLDNLTQITIGQHCCISQGALLLCGNHRFDQSRFDLTVHPITLENGVWVGAKALIAPGAHLLSHTVVTAGAVFKGKSEPYSIYQGNPAVKIKSRVIGN